MDCRGIWGDDMEREDIRVAVVRIEGTNCERETALAFKRLEVFAEEVHLKQFYSDMIRDEDKRSLHDYHAVVFPGGFSAGDYIRAGAIFSARVRSVLRKDLKKFIGEGWPVLGICNGFQVLVELGALPAFDGISEKPEMALGINDSSRFECRPTFLKVENQKILFTRNLGKNVVMFPSAHAEGKVIFPSGREEEYIERLKENNQIVFRYVDRNGDYAGYPWNPNGSIYNIAGICNPEGNVLGLMPHPERAFHPVSHPEWTRNQQKDGDGKGFFEGIVSYLEKKV